MRIHTFLWLVTGAGTAFVLGCGPNEVDMGQGGSNPTPTPTATATATPSATPNPAGFNAIQTVLEIAATPNRANCGQATCHIAPNGGTAPFAMYTAPGTAAADVDKNRLQLSCAPNIDDYTPQGLIIATFCNANGTALAAPQHAGRTNLTDADCAGLFAWLQTGTGTPVACP